MNKIGQSVMSVAVLTLVAFSPLSWSVGPTPAESFAEEQAGDGIAKKGGDVVNADYYVEVEFAPGSKALTSDSQQKIQSLINNAKKAGSISSVSILSWADDEFPSANVKALPEPQKVLAAQRNSSLKQYVTQTHKAPVTTYSMAEQSNALQKFLGTTDARLKRSLVAAGLPTTADNPRFPSKASRSLVFVTVQ